MKVNWFSPLPPAKTGIALCTETLIPALQERAEVTLWTNQPEWEPRIQQIADVRRFDPQRPPWGELNTANVNF